MTIQGAVYELEQMLLRADIPDYIKPTIKKIIETVVDEFSDQQVDKNDEESEDYRWIPCSERLPEENDTYEVTLRGISELEGITEIAYATWLNNNWLYHDVDDWQYKEVIAWKTRTQPYKAESET